MAKNHHNIRNAPSWLKEAHKNHNPSKENGVSKEFSQKKHNFFFHIYDKHYKKLLVIPMILLFLALFIVISKYATTGEFINRGVTLKGGLTLQIYEQMNVSEEQLTKDIETNFSKSSVDVSILKNIDGSYRATSIYASGMNGTDLMAFISNKYNISFSSNNNNYQINEMESSFSNDFFQQLIVSILIAFVFMAIVVFIIYRIPVPSFAVILSVFADIVETIAVFDLLGIQISSASIAAFIMLIGYSVDTDILLSAKVLRQEGNLLDKVIESIKTGMMMVTTAFVVVTICYIFTSSSTLKEIMLVIMIGTLFDIINTWITNAALLRMYVERKK